MKRISIIALFLLAIMNPLYGELKQNHSIVIGFLQLKEKFNAGMVFNGVQLEYRYGLLWETENAQILYQPKLAFGIGFNRNMKGYQAKIAPINVSWITTVFEQNGHHIQGGLNFVMDYSYHLYPDLQGGHLFWASEIGLSPVLKYSYEWNKKRIAVNMQNSLLGFVSHTPENEPYFYSFKAKDFFAQPHTNMRFGSFNNYNHSIVSVEFTPNISKIHSLAYELDYFGSFYGARFERLNHHLFWRMTL